MNIQYIVALICLCAAYAVCMYLMKYMRRAWLANLIFGCAVYLPYVWLCSIVYKSVGFYDWNFQNVLPVANVSPFMFSLMPILLLLPKRVKKHFYLLISLLSVGMFISTVLGCVYNASINYRLHFHFMLDYAAHFCLSLFGIYLIRTKQVKLELKSCLISSSIIIGSATVMLILNLIFDKAFFGLSLKGKHNIYNNVLTKSSYLSALLYYLGLVGVLCMGYALCRIFAKDKLAVSTKENE